MTKLCTKCDQIKALSEFCNHKGNKDGKAYYCKACLNAASVKWGANNPDKRNQLAREWRAKNPIKVKQYAVNQANNGRGKQYGVSAEYVAYLIEKQGNKCLICKVDFKDSRRRPNIDHDHKTGVVRGVLCFHCNAGLGFFKDDIKALTEAVDYLTKGLLHQKICAKL